MGDQFTPPNAEERARVRRLLEEAPFTPTPIPTRDDLITHIRDELRAFNTFAFHALKRPTNHPEHLHPWDALELIHTGSGRVLEVIDAAMKEETI